jgi:uncharacterized delta-60 repeat protein
VVGQSYVVLRLNADGSVDSSFTASNYNGPGLITAQTDGKILATGDALAGDGSLHGTITRLNPDGTPDASFTPADLDADTISGLVEQADGKLVVAGYFAFVNGAAHANIVRLNTDGSVDSTFNASTDAGDGINALALQPDGKILIGGVFQTVDGVAHSPVARLHPDGSLDTYYAAAATSGETVTALAVQTNGQVIVDGYVTPVTGQFDPLLVRLNPHPAFFSGEAALTSGVYYLQLPNGNLFGYYAYVSDPDYIYHFDLGYEFVFDANDGKGGAYLYDFASSTFFYTSPVFPFPYLYDFTLGTVLYYYPDSQRAGHYTTDPRYFYDFATGAVITK